MKFSQAFERDYAWYDQWKDTFDFDGANDYLDRYGRSKIVPDPLHGVPAKQAFYHFDSAGLIVPTSEPELLRELYRCKGSINLHIQQWAEGRKEGTLPKLDWENIKQEFNLLPWMDTACTKQYLK
jgi:hypothetical protein